MKKLILLELALLFLATTFRSDNPPGWYQQILPVADQINDIFFLDSLNGWIVTKGHTNSNDTGYILRTSNGGTNWIIQFRQNINLNVIQLVNSDVGYAGGGSGSGTRFMYKTTNGGNNWIEIIGSLGEGSLISDMSFINSDTGWFCDDDLFDGGVFKTIDGGNSWIRQTEVGEFRKLFFLNKDTGWVYGSTTTQQRLYRTINGGTNWELQFVSAFEIGSIFFLNGKKGWMRGGPDLLGNGASYTTDGGFKWSSSYGNVSGGYDIKFVNDSIGYSGGTFFKIPKSTDGGRTFGYQISPIQTSLQTSFLKNDTLLGWMGYNGLIKTADGGGIIVDIQNNINHLPPGFKLEQNYPNPFNPVTKINYDLSESGYVRLEVFDIAGKEKMVIVNQEQNSGKHTVEFDAAGMPSGVYFYRLEVTYNHKGETYSDTKKMILIR